MIEQLTYNFVVHSNESAPRKLDILGWTPSSSVYDSVTDLAYILFFWQRCQGTKFEKPNGNTYGARSNLYMIQLSIWLIYFFIDIF